MKDPETVEEQFKFLLWEWHKGFIKRTAKKINKDEFLITFKLKRDIEKGLVEKNGIIFKNGVVKFKTKDNDSEIKVV